MYVCIIEASIILIHLINNITLDRVIFDTINSEIEELLQNLSNCSFEA